MTQQQKATKNNRNQRHLLWTFLAATVLSVRSVALFWMMVNDSIRDDDGHFNNDLLLLYQFDRGRILSRASSTVFMIPNASNDTNTTANTTGGASWRHIQSNYREGQSTVNHNSKILLFITTPLSERHMEYFHGCWSSWMEQLGLLLPHMDVQIFATNRTTVPTQYIDEIKTLFRYNPNLQFKYLTAEVQDQSVQQRPRQRGREKGKVGANLGSELGFRNGWFTKYDWIINIIPDILIRNSTWMVQQLFDPTVDGIFLDCGEDNDRSDTSRIKKINTDFFAVRPSVLVELQQQQVLSSSTTSISASTTIVGYGRHEVIAVPPLQDDDTNPSSPFGTMVREVTGTVGGEESSQNKPVGDPSHHNMTPYYKYFAPIIESGRHRFLPSDSVLSDGRDRCCRGWGNHSSVHYAHDSCCLRVNDKNNGDDNDDGIIKRKCTALEGWDIS